MAHKISNECINCETCVAAGPVEAISESDGYIIDPDTCTD